MNQFTLILLKPQTTIVLVNMIPDERLGHGFLIFKQYSDEYGSGWWSPSTTT
jgi:hypothetical protein